MNCYAPPEARFLKNLCIWLLAVFHTQNQKYFRENCWETT